MAAQFAVVHFTNPDDNSVDIVPAKWLSSDGNNCLWPKENVTPAFSNHKLNPNFRPKKGWVYHPCVVKGKYGKSLNLND